MCLSKETKAKIKDVSQEIKRSLVIITKERDKIRVSLEEATEIEDSITEAIEDLESGLDNLSQYI